MNQSWFYLILDTTVRKCKATIELTFMDSTMELNSCEGEISFDSSTSYMQIMFNESEMELE